jgi:rhamnosyltransferase
MAAYEHPAGAIREVSVIVRARDEAASIARCLSLVAEQRTSGYRHEVIVVDSGSRDGTVDLAEAAGARVLRMASEDFSFGRALNLGAQSARGEVLIALSAHAFLPDPGWLQRTVAWFGDETVACASGDRFGPAGERLGGPVRQDLELARRHPHWGYSNAAGAFRADLWQARRFREDLPGREDQEWARHWMGEGKVVMIDPALIVEHDHSHDPLPSIYRRARREAEGLGAYVELPPYGARELIGEWWSDLRFYDSALKARLSHRRAARLLGNYAGRRRGQADGAGSRSG